MFNEKMAAEGALQSAILSESMVLKQERTKILLHCLISLVLAPASLVILLFSCCKRPKLFVKMAAFTLNAAMCTVVTLPLIFINLAKFGTITMWYANKAYHMFSGKNIQVEYQFGKLEDFNEDRYEAWLRQAIASSK